MGYRLRLSGSGVWGSDVHASEVYDLELRDLDFPPAHCKHPKQKQQGIKSYSGLGFALNRCYVICVSSLYTHIQSPDQILYIPI